MIPHHLLCEHREAIIDAAHRSALLQLNSLERLNTRTMAAGRQMLARSEGLNGGDPIAAAGASISDLGSHSLDTYRYFLEVTGDSCAKWTDLCEEHWRGAHDRLRSAFEDYARRVPGEAGMAIFFARRAEDPAAVAAESKGLLAEAADRIATDSSADDAEPAPAGKRSRKAA